MTITFEMWKPIKGYEGIYEASTEGAIRPVKPRFKTSPVLKPGDNGTGHLQVTLVKDGVKSPSTQVSHLVWEAFYGPVPEGKEIDHKNEDPRDNRLCNLQAISHHQNILRGTAIERSAFGHRKPVRAYLGEEEVGHFGSIKEAALYTGLSEAIISRAASGKCEKAGGYKWYYAEPKEEKPKRLFER